ncbi:MAG TPA: sulfatase-like hydrolase/transferase [Opitutaceae bacterium]|jgi:arylsulfatase A-like enzyme|nr:sulfatase-like hydrolase/transferase [Opitutaceae bacterium]
MSAAGPNILWIVTTQWRAQACGYAGDPNARTPCLDAFAAESLDFTQAVTPHPFGPFARAAMLTGVPSPENGVRDYFDPLPADARTLAHALGEHGYATAFFGKWHLGKRDPAAPLVGEAHAKIIVPPEARGGFEFWEGFESGFLLNNPWLHGTRLAQPEQFEGYQSDVVCARAAHWVGGQIPNHKSQTPKKVQPWFCMVSLEAPHPPYAALSAGIVAREPGAIELPANVPRGGEIERQARRELAGYYAHIEATDRAIGSLLAHAPRENTLVVFTSVHGDMHGAQGLFRKGWPHEESVRVPLVVRGLRPMTNGEYRMTNANAVSLVDLPAMMLAEVENLESQISDFKFQIRNSFARISMPSVVHLPQQCDRAWRGVRTKTRKLVLNSHSAGSGQADGSPWLFFDLQNDPHELRNLVSDASRAQEMAELRALIG